MGWQKSGNHYSMTSKDESQIQESPEFNRFMQNDKNPYQEHWIILASPTK